MPPVSRRNERIVRGFAIFMSLIILNLILYLGLVGLLDGPGDTGELMAMGIVLSLQLTFLITYLIVRK
ncbi:hypothetical protein N6H14_06375 [Paenibacillus sp. CC-CFT747]|nr:hypothetical protein N6H14_06375 [Paenibacillus sp. CC-CFT747]